MEGKFKRTESRARSVRQKIHTDGQYQRHHRSIKSRMCYKTKNKYHGQSKPKEILCNLTGPTLPGFTFCPRSQAFLAMRRQSVSSNALQLQNPVSHRLAVQNFLNIYHLGACLILRMKGSRSYQASGISRQENVNNPFSVFFLMEDAIETSQLCVPVLITKTVAWCPNSGILSPLRGPDQNKKSTNTNKKRKAREQN